MGPKGFGLRPPITVRIDPDYGGARCSRRLHDDLTGHAEPKDCDRVADADLRIMDAVQRYRANVGEDADARISVLRHGPVARIFGGYHRLAAMVPGAEHLIAYGHATDFRAGFDYLA